MRPKYKFTIPGTVVKNIIPEINKVYFINQYSLLYILEGDGQIQVDFKNYEDWINKAIFLEKGQYIKFLADDFKVRIIEFPDEVLFKTKDVRILFKHLISLGYIDYNRCDDCQLFLSDTVFNSQLNSLLDISTKQWYWQNPFGANKEEYKLIFDVKEIIDHEYSAHINTEQLISQLENSPFHARKLIKDKVGISISRMLLDKQFLESQKQIAFTDKNIQEIAYDNGYRNPAYFNRVFKNRSGRTPGQFRTAFDFDGRDSFVQDIVYLIKEFHRHEHQLQFYADRMNLSVKALSKKVRLQLNTSLGKLIRTQIIRSAKTMLQDSESVKEVAFALGFEEANHFSSFYRKYTGQSPSEVRN